jgi:hypothetical protein
MLATASKCKGLKHQYMLHHPAHLDSYSFNNTYDNVPFYTGDRYPLTAVRRLCVRT